MRISHKAQIIISSVSKLKTHNKSIAINKHVCVILYYNKKITLRNHKQINKGLKFKFHSMKDGEWAYTKK